MKWIPYPMVRIAAFFIAGILIAIYLPEVITTQAAVFISLILLALYYVLVFLKKTKTGFAIGVTAFSLILVLGYLRLQFYRESGDDSHLLSIPTKVQAFRAIVRSVPEEKVKSWKVEVELTDVKTTDWQPAKGRILLYVRKDSLSPNWKYGDYLLVKGSPSEIKPPANPGEFDFKRFLGFKNIYHQQFIQSHEAMLLGRAEARSFIYYSHEARWWSLQQMKRFVRGDQLQAIASALVLGVTDGLDNDLLNAYAASGAMHVLAVSGLHVGIIYAIILFLMKPLQRYSWSRWLIAAVSLLFLWSFAFVTGLSPSVLRAVAMFSFIAVARPLGWKTNIYNTLAASAFVLLVYNPYLVMSVGFQLSYLAVIGIVYLQRPLYNLWDVSSRVGDWIWQITCVSIAAQVATFSLGLLYFHQFPVYFLVSNLFVIPLSTLVLVIGILLLAVSFFSPLAQFTGLMLESIIRALNWIVFQTESIPFSLINNIYLSTFQCWLLMAVLLSLILLFEKRNIRWLYLSFFLASWFSVAQWAHFSEEVKGARWIVYAINGRHGMEFLSNGQSYFLSDSALAADKERTRFHIQPNRLHHGISQTHSGFPFSKDTLGVTYFLWQGKWIGLVFRKEFQLPEQPTLDYLVVSSDLLSAKAGEDVSANKIIFDATNADSLLQQLDKGYVVLKEGAFVLND